MKKDRRDKLEDKLFELMENTVERLNTRVKQDDCTAADINAAINALKLNDITLEKAGRKGDDPDLPDEEEIDLPFPTLVAVK